MGTRILVNQRGFFMPEINPSRILGYTSSTLSLAMTVGKVSSREQPDFSVNTGGFVKK